MDNFYEQLAATYKTGTYKLLNACVYFFGALAVISMAVIPVFILSLLIAIACFFGKKKLYVEYEYAFTNGEIDIDKIVEMKKRKRVMNFQIKEVELLAPENSYYVKDFLNVPNDIVSCYPKTTDKDIYVAMITGGNKRVKLRFTPDEEFLSLCFKYNPRAVKKS
ncbi:DUF6106 family protein [Candidatus Clostridium radicumherbarum]|uniref:DUF6106 family protein n=1 Tax=Candidatus Clostridium radicumherbarum TaxID=3381662 RepID=A0ABW8TTG3_9CLOT